jgi:hypothetical protein
VEQEGLVQDCLAAVVSQLVVPVELEMTQATPVTPDK